MPLPQARKVTAGHYPIFWRLRCSLSLKWIDELQVLVVRLVQVVIMDHDNLAPSVKNLVF